MSEKRLDQQVPPGTGKRLSGAMGQVLTLMRRWMSPRSGSGRTPGFLSDVLRARRAAAQNSYRIACVGARLDSVSARFGPEAAAAVGRDATRFTTREQGSGIRSASTVPNPNPGRIRT